MLKKTAIRPYSLPHWPAFDRYLTTVQARIFGIYRRWASGGHSFCGRPEARATAVRDRPPRRIYSKQKTAVHDRWRAEFRRRPDPGAVYRYSLLAKQDPSIKPEKLEKLQQLLSDKISRYEAKLAANPTSGKQSKLETRLKVVRAQLEKSRNL